MVAVGKAIAVYVGRKALIGAAKSYGSKIFDIDKGFDRIFKGYAKAEAEKMSVLAGVVGPRANEKKDSREDDGNVSTSMQNVATIADILEFGKPGGSVFDRPIPARKFLRNPFDSRKHLYERIIRRNAERSEDGLTGLKSGLWLAAEAYVGHVQLAINRREYPALHPVTIAARPKNDDLPLVDTGQLRQAIGVRREDQVEYIGRKKQTRKVKLKTKIKRWVKTARKKTIKKIRKTKKVIRKHIIEAQRQRRRKNK